MVYIWLILFGLSLGSFINALVWRLREQEQLLVNKPKGIGKQLRKLSITRGRSMCTHCGHTLAPLDLIPVISWVSLRGKCRYCQKPINDTPLTELLLPFLFVMSYAVWPYAADGWAVIDIVIFAIWALILTCFLALAVYDAKWFILPDKIVAPTTLFALVMVVLLAYDANDWYVFLDAVIASISFFAVFYALFQISNERWIGGGDVKLAVSLGLIAGSPLAAMLLLFIASCIGSLVALPSLLSRKSSFKSVLPFGPFLLSAAVIVFLWGADILDWYLGAL